MRRQGQENVNFCGTRFIIWYNENAEELKLSIITISRQICSFGDEIATALSQKLGWALIPRDVLMSTFLSRVADDDELYMLTQSAKHYLKKIKGGAGTYLRYIDNTLHEFTKTQSAVLVGFGSQALFAGQSDALHVRVVSPKDVRIARVRKQYRVSEEEAEQILAAADRKQKRFVYTTADIDIADPVHYHLTLNTGVLSVDEAVAAITAMHAERVLELQLLQESEGTPVINNATSSPVMKNQAEAEFAKILDIYQIDWKYEPKTFPIEWDAEGNITSAFSPDFYLPKFNTYIELTTMNQKYVTEKNKKVKKLRELYPGTNIKIVYKKDFHSLIERFKTDKGD